MHLKNLINELICNWHTRQIMKIDLSKTKSMRLGESKKLVKVIFDDFKNSAKKSKL